MGVITDWTVSYPSVIVSFLHFLAPCLLKTYKCMPNGSLVYNGRTVILTHVTHQILSSSAHLLALRPTRFMLFLYPIISIYPQNKVNVNC